MRLRNCGVVELGRLQSRFTFYGVSYDRMYVGSNGYIGFERAVNMPHSHRYVHYSRPRVSALFADLDPSSAGGGTVKSFQDADKVVVSYNDVTLYGNPALKVSFQVRGPMRCGSVRGVVSVARLRRVFSIGRGQGTPLMSRLKLDSVDSV